jgi:hypothetical protein
MERCDHCDEPIDTNGYEWKLVGEWAICRKCVEQSPEDYGY